jgi:hypothetical protein
METFQKNVIIVATIVLIICLFFVLSILKNSLENATWPPIKSSCPDYWDASLNPSGNGERCINNSNVNTCNNNWPVNLQTVWGGPGGKVYGPTQGGFCSGTNSDPGLDPLVFTAIARGSRRPDDLNCAKYKWAKYEGVTWDGITNNKNICKNATV